MASSGKAPGSKLDKLRLVVKKSDLIIGMLEKKGVNTKDQKEKIDKAKENLDQGNIEEAYKVAMECIVELKKMQDNGAKESSGKRGKGVFALIRDNTQDMDRKIEEWKVIITGWRNKGYHFEEDKSLFSRSFDQIEKRFISIGEQIEKAEQIRSQITRYREDYSHVGKSYLKKIDDIERAVFRLDRLDDIERRLKTVVKTIGSVEGRYESLRNRISRFRRKGLSTISLDEMLDNDEDLDYLDKQFNIYESNIDFLLKEKKKLKDLKGSIEDDRFEKKVRDLENIIDDPWKLDQVVEMMLELETIIKDSKDMDLKKEEARKRRNEIQKSLKKYSAEGFKVDMVEQLLDDDINLLEEEYDIFIRQTSKLRSLKEKLFKLDATGFEEDVSNISEKLYDPTNLDQLETELNQLKDRILNQRIRKQKIENAIKEWSGMGFKVNKLETLLGTNIVEAEKLYNVYSGRITELADYEARIKEINQKDVQDLVHRINLKIKNPELIDSIRKEMERLQQQVSESDRIRTKRSELNNLLKTWRSQGYIIDQILEDTKNEKTIEGLEKVILDYTRAIASLESFRSEFPSYERGWIPNWENDVKEHMMDPMKANVTLKKFTKLKSLIKKEEKKRGEISRKLDELSSRGIVVSRIKDLLTGDANTLNEEYTIFRKNVTRLLKLKASLLREAKSESDQELEMFSKGMNDPYMIETYEHQTMNRDTLKVSLDPSSDEKDVNVLKEQAKELYRQDKLEGSLEMFKRILQIDPDNKESKFYIKKVTQKLKTRKVLEETASNEDAGSKGTGPEEVKDESSSTGQGDPNCLSCKGTGKCVWCDGGGVCSTCNGSGKTFGDDCPTCGGKGKCSVCKGSGKCSWCNS